MVEKFFKELDFGFAEKNSQKSDNDRNQTKNEKIFGKSFCVTGSFENFSRDEIHAQIENLGGEVKYSVSAKLDYLIAGEKAGSKMQKAVELGVEILDLEKFLEMI